MTPPPLPPGVEGHPVAPDVHTGCAEPERDGFDISAEVVTQIDGWIAERDRFRDECSRLADQVERLKADRRALDIAVTGLRELEDTWTDEATAAAVEGIDADPNVAAAIRECRDAVSALLDKIGGTR